MLGFGWRPELGGFAWVNGNYGSIPSGAVVAGRDVDGSTLYVGRAFHEGDLLPAKVVPSHAGAYVSYGGAEHKKTEYEVLCSANVAWQYSQKGEVPPNAIQVGYTSTGEKLYVGRVMHEGSLTPGKVQPSHGVLYIPFGGEEISHEDYEILVSI